MAYSQVVSFNLKKMGTTKNFCLRNVRQGYGIGAKYANAKLAMNENKKLGTLHDLSSIPTNCAVPVFSDKGVFGHVEVCDKGKYYSDGKRVAKPNNSFKWGEYLNGVRVVKKTTTPTTTIKIGDTVIVNGAGTATSTGGGAKTKVFKNQKMKVIDIRNSRYGCNQYNKMGGITGWWTAGQIKKG